MNDQAVRQIKGHTNFKYAALAIAASEYNFVAHATWDPAGADKSSVQVRRLVIGGGRIRLAPAVRRWALP